MQQFWQSVYVSSTYFTHLSLVRPVPIETLQVGVDGQPRHRRRCQLNHGRWRWMVYHAFCDKFRRQLVNLAIDQLPVNVDCRPLCTVSTVNLSLYSRSGNSYTQWHNTAYIRTPHYNQLAAISNSHRCKLDGLNGKPSTSMHPSEKCIFAKCCLWPWPWAMTLKHHQCHQDVVMSNRDTFHQNISTHSGVR